ncbi:MAG TPA: MFS transporter, partial [Burkholderiales bacterium]|nr:MFS transporter [Burkholderiales bacterium]
AAIGLAFSLFGVTGFVGNVLATRLVTSAGAFATSVLSLGCILLGLGLWSVGIGTLPLMLAGIAVWGLGFAAINSMQQARLVAAAPALGAASVSLNTSAIYVGQAIGSALGGLLFARNLPLTLGYAAMSFVALALVLLATTRESRIAVLRPDER